MSASSSSASGRGWGLTVVISPSVAPFALGSRNAAGAEQPLPFRDRTHRGRSAMTVTEIPSAIHRGDEELPWVDIGDGSLLKVLHIKEREGLWVIRNRFMPGYQVQTHKHTGPVYAFTTTGAWRYKESDFVNRAGSFLYEP